MIVESGCPSGFLKSTINCGCINDLFKLCMNSILIQFLSLKSQNISDLAFFLDDIVSYRQRVHVHVIYCSFTWQNI